MRISLRQLQIFIAICRSGSTAAAAELVSLSQSATSASLNELESLLNTELFDRIGKKLVLNENGRQILPHAMQAIDISNSIQDQFNPNKQHTKSSLHIGASTTIGNYLLPSLLSEYAKEAAILPQIEIANTSNVASAVANFEVEFGLIEGPCHETDLLVEKWLEDELIIVSSNDHPLAIKSRRSKVTSKDLAGAGWLLRESKSGTREAVENLLKNHMDQLNSAGEFSNSEAIKRSAAEGLGIACLSRSVVSDLLALGRLVELSTTLPPLTRNLYIIQNKHKVISRWNQGFLEHCRKKGRMINKSKKDSIS
ncbi:LysR family transcriptional regulator [Polynucleobacter sinensis]|uniref:LysR family transcriptional regulator n=1 Tax=Polynucleobacter sinensis TaxID=1743157 RepID=UPI000783ED6B|nr:LysR family transcriptional regulator [Polynucleobacter sinensis]